MKKVTVFASLLALAIGASAQSAIHVGPSARPSKNATNATINVPPVATVPPVAVKGGKKK